MSDTSVQPDLSDFEIATDIHTQPFWTAAAEGRLVFPRCSQCHSFRWPPGPFCAACHSQQTEWIAAGAGRIFSYTVIPSQSVTRVVGLIEFPGAGGVRLTASIVDAPMSQLRIDAEVDLCWIRAANANIPAFRLKRSS